MSVGVTLQPQPVLMPYLAFLEAAGMTGTGLTVETADEPDAETLPLTQEGGHAPTLAVPIIEVTKTSSAWSETAPKAKRASTARSSLTGVGDLDLCIGVGTLLSVMFAVEESRDSYDYRQYHHEGAWNQPFSAARPHIFMWGGQWLVA